ncbi:hypothetical protein KI387_030163, partial [Taxus chinensis]
SALKRDITPARPLQTNFRSRKESISEVEIQPSMVDNLAGNYAEYIALPIDIREEIFLANFMGLKKNRCGP